MFYKISGNTIEKMSNLTMPISNFKMGDGYSLGGDCDENFIQKNNADSLSDCAKECLDHQNCQRFSFGQHNLEGGPGLKCRISDNGKCPITVDRFRNELSQGKKLDFDNQKYGLNFYGGQVFDKKTPEEIANTKVINNSKSVIQKSSSNLNMINNNSKSLIQKSSSNLKMVNGNIVKDNSSNLKIVDGKVIVNEVNNKPVESEDYRIYIIVSLVILILGVGIYYFKISKSDN